MLKPLWALPSPPKKTFRNTIPFYSFCVGHQLLYLGPAQCTHLIVWFVYPIKHQWKKLNFPLQLINSELGMWAHVHFPSPLWGPVWRRLMWALCISHSLSQFMCTSALWCLECLVFLLSSIPSGSYNRSASSSSELPEPWGRDLVETSHWGLNVPQSLTHCTRPCVGLYVQSHLPEEEASWYGWAKPWPMTITESC